MKDSQIQSENDEKAEETKTEFLQLWGKLVAQSWEDETLRQRLRDDPAGVLTEHGAEFSEGVTVKVIQELDNIIYLPLPPKPELVQLTDEQLTDDQLTEVVGGRQLPAQDGFKAPRFSFKGKSVNETKDAVTVVAFSDLPIVFVI